jgi:hypothetical protein
VGSFGTRLPANTSDLCQRCGSQVATYRLASDDVSPPSRQLLCLDCLHAELGRKIAPHIGHLLEPPLPRELTDDQARDLYRRFMSRDSGGKDHGGEDK